MKRKIYHIADVARILGVFVNRLCHLEEPIDTLAYDSRKVGYARSALFFALKGRRDGHLYIGEAYGKGIRHFVVSQEEDYERQFPEANFLLVADTMKALQRLAAYHRSCFSYPVMAITGSNGKTVVKEWLYELLSPEYRIVRSPKSFNSQLGVALSLWEMDENAELAIIEAGISKIGEMESLQGMIKPTWGILTNVGHAHSAGFESKEEKIIEKLKLFKGVDRLVYNPRYIEGVQLPPVGEVYTWGEQADVQLWVYEKLPQPTKGTLLRARLGNKNVDMKVPFSDAASLENVTCCWAVLLSLGYEQREIERRIGGLSSVGMRLEMKNGLNNCSIIDDSYSNDSSSLRIALDFLAQQQQHEAKVLILSDIPAKPQDESGLYQKVANLVNAQELSLFVGIGERIGLYRHFFGGKSSFYRSTEDFLRSGLSFHHSTVLLKGARSFFFERISRALSSQLHDTVLEINLNALEHNLNLYRSILPQGVKLMVMVKAFSYGSGSFEIANLLQFNRVDYLAVAYGDEGVTLRRAGINLPILVMNPDLQRLDIILQYRLEPEIYSLKAFKALVLAIEQMEDGEEWPCGVHIKMDTGMHRLGFTEEELPALLEFLCQQPNIRVKSVFSHLVASGAAQHDDFTRHQINLFREMAQRVRQVLPYEIMMHIANTAAISRFPEASFDMVRLGIGLYGVLEEGHHPLPLLTVATLKTSIAQIKRIQAGDTIGYNRNGMLKGDGSGRTATVKIGYADGYNRRFGNGLGHMLVNGEEVPTVGDICMDMCMLDISRLHHVKEGDEVIVMGDKLRVNTLADTIHTIPYEVLTGISPRVRRVYFYE